MNEQNEKQAIEEMRELIHAEIKKAVDSGLVTWTEFAQYLTERFTEQGYRKQKEAEWVMIPVNGVARWRCGNIDCARIIPFGTVPSELKYCPSCGAKMKGGVG